MIVLAGVSPCLYAQNCEKLSGEVGASSRWGSGWIDLAAELRRGERLRVQVGGSATKVLIRVLRSGELPDDPVGIVGEFAVPANRIAEVVLKEDLKSVKQISVHGGPNPWGKFPLGSLNGPATLLGVERCFP